MGGLSGSLSPSAGRLGVLGGTFDPPHRLHLAVAHAALDQLGLQRVLFIPAGDPWRKADRPVSPAPHRLAMTRLAIAPEPEFTCSDIEIRRAGPTHTLDTLVALMAQRDQRRDSDSQLWFIVGSDALTDLPQWYEPERLIAASRLAVVVRPGTEVDPASLDGLVPGLAARVDWVCLDPDPLSATDLRRRIASAEPITADLPAAVRDYVRRNQLYR